MIPHSLRGVPAARNLAKLTAMGLIPAEPLGKGSTEAVYRHLGATEPYRGAFAPAPPVSVPPAPDQFADPAPDPDFEDDAPAPFTDEENQDHD